MAFSELTTMPPAHLFTKPPSVLKQEDFPALTVKLGNVPNTPGVELKTGNAWEAKQKLFADAPAAIAPPVELLRSMNVKNIEEGEEDPMDPDSRSFNAMKFYINLIGKFRCPHRGCGKSIEHKGAFIQHLKSPAHRNEKLQCINCLRYFATATALTQHCESQGVRCKVRQTSEYDGVIDGITGGTAITAGRHVDDTIKYAINPEILPTLTTASVVEAHRARLEEKNKKRQHFWDDRTAKW
ncbi:hypothetical protein F5882DRAFT_108298 [Hyaloscypha sp. PMI_1271]|nr:hypothetical protein F5882DRAFT_108298 [Hyaloscypha sp. PMI_1271]